MSVQRTPGSGMPSFAFPSNRRDGARQLSIVVLLATASLVRIDHPIGRVLLLITASLALYWWGLYRRLER